MIGAAATAWLYRRFPEDREGRLSRRRQALVSRAPLAATAARLGLEPLLRMGKGEAAAHGERRPAVLADAFEALVGAVFLAEGYAAAARFVEREHLMHAEPRGEADARTALQELAQARLRAIPRYTVTGESGPAHARVFNARVSVGEVVGTGSGPTKKQAQAEAAAEALRKLEKIAHLP